MVRVDWYMTQCVPRHISNCSYQGASVLFPKNSTGTCLSKEVCLYAGTDWRKLMSVRGWRVVNWTGCLIPQMTEKYEGKSLGSWKGDGDVSWLHLQILY